jgi:multidrug resistance efflux pump
MRKRVVAISLVVSVLALGLAAGGAALLFLMQPEQARRVIERDPLVVRAERVEPTTIQETLIGFGTARADLQASVSAEVGGRVIGIDERLREGLRVEAGTVLVRLDDRDYRAQLERATSQLTADQAALENLAIEEQRLEELIAIAENEFAIAERDYERVLNLYEQDMAGQRELDLARTTVQAARRVLTDLRQQLAQIPNLRRQLEASVEQKRAEVRLAELSLERTTIAAPFDGTIERVAIEEGELVAAGTALFSMLNQTQIEVPIELPISWYNRVAEGAPVEITLETDSARSWRGRIARISPSGSASLRTFPVYIEIDNRRQSTPLVPGQFVQAEIEGRAFTNALAVPRGSVQENQVFVFDDGTARRRVVQIRERLREQALVEGIAPGAIVITSNLDMISEGMAVRLDQQTAMRLNESEPDGAATGDKTPISATSGARQS